ncbi:UNVERIFIED_CONTAM: hypothetical protein GTU68_004545 [Idotea baltica]|nr:hypothetical protein [Idotea baltica]
MIAELAEFEKLSDQLVATEADFQEALFGKSPSAEALIATDPANAEKLVGYAIFFSTFSTFVGKAGIWLEDIYVKPEFRGTKLGKNLLQTLAGIAKDRNAGRLEWCVLDWNQRAIDFYQHIGSDVMPDWRICRMNREELVQFAAEN